MVWDRAVAIAAPATSFPGGSSTNIKILRPCPIIYLKINGLRHHHHTFFLTECDSILHHLFHAAAF